MAWKGLENLLRFVIHDRVNAQTQVKALGVLPPEVQTYFPFCSNTKTKQAASWTYISSLQVA